MEIKPDKKLITKSWMILLTISLFIVVFSFFFYLIPVLDREVDFNVFIDYLWRIVSIVIIAMWLISAPIMILWIKNLSYFIEDDRIVIHKGIITKIQQNIPMRMITDFMLERSLYDRWLGIGSIKIQTAGQTQNATGYEGKLSGLIKWEELYKTLREKISKSDLTGSKKVETSGDKITSLTDILLELKKVVLILEERKK
ncbi:MAG: PH domain-containing protein [Candidatus Cloacimonetes bacterium]|nr:PH domain-containing protein [Candidatus Cloacimonadota bacterium]